MFLVDVNILIYAFRTESPRHDEYAAWLDDLMNGPAPYATADVVLNGVIRTLTHPKIFKAPESTDDAVEYVRTFSSQPHCVYLRPDDRHRRRFWDLCVQTNARGNDVSDVFLAALAIEENCEVVTADTDFRRIPDVRFLHPLDV